ncbi:uncharacterized protein LOC129581444 [Paramacrobiotus metropolitanus]|uniref:uncharacterized protein LOC129581444 n=1 Tax=Paramacrobiotus metropolitanus TaxID=2943436 RepID=UPI002445CB5C|nr:uncharacterized protein LOC129581444 [Paramacrobiotus metropolitanus]
MCEEKNGLIHSMLILLFISNSCFYAHCQQITLEDVLSRQSLNETSTFGDPARLDHALVNGTVPLKRVPRNVPATNCWPKAPFALLRAATGCPGGGAWGTGEVRHRLRAASSVSQQNLLSAQITKEAVTLEFCVRDPPADTSDEPVDYDCSHVNADFPPGSYCIFNAQQKFNIYERCPPGFNWSAVGLDDIGTVNRRTRGRMPTGEFFDTFTHYYFCCRNDSAPSNHMVLPTKRPFILFPLGVHRACQEVVGLRARMFSIYMDADHGSYVNHPNRFCSPFAETDSVIEGVGPCAREKRGKGLQLHMCHYSLW